uniref:SAM domain-containing protein n=1 Tax=Panagrellus redivivus TaxID=6233 RepID=A0A7E4V1V0_PANRE
MNEAKQMSARSVPQGSTSISSNLGGNANGVVMPTASTSTHFNGGSATAFLSPTKPDMVKMSQSLKATQAQKSQFKSVQVISQQSNLSGPSGTNCVVLQHVGGGNSSHNLAFSSMVDNNQAQGSPMYQSGSQAFLSPPRPVQNPTNATGNQTSDGNHVQMQTAQIPARYTHIDGRQVQMIQLNNNQYYQVGQGGQPIAIQQYVQQPQQQFVTRNGSVVFASQANQDGSRILQALPTQVHIQNTVSPQNTSFHLTKAALKNVKSVNQSPSSTRRSDPLQPASSQGAATSSSQYLASSQPSSSSTAYEKSPASSTQVFSPPPAKPKNRSRSSKSKSKASPQQQQQQVVTQTQHVTNNNGQPTATIQQIALPANSQSRNQIPASNNQSSTNDASSKNSNHQSGVMQGQGSSQQTAASQQHGPAGASSQQHGSVMGPSQQRGSSMAPSQQHGTSAPSSQQLGPSVTSSQQQGSSIVSSQPHGTPVASSQNQPDYSNNKQQQHPSQTAAGPPPKSPNTQAMPPPPLPTVRPMVPQALPTSGSKPQPPPSAPNSSAGQQQPSQPASSTAGPNTQQMPPVQPQWKLEKAPALPPNQQQRKILHARRPPPGKQQTVPQTQQSVVPQGQHIRLQSGQVIQLKQPLTQSLSKIPTKEELEKKAMPPPPVPAPKPRVTVLPPVPPPVLISPVPSDLDTVWERALNFAFNSNAPKWSFNQMRSHFRRLIYENECYQSQLREYHQRLLKLERDNNYLMDRLLPYENISSSDGEDSDSSTKTIEERVVVQKLTKKRPAHRPSGSAPPKKKGASSKPVAPPTNGVSVPPPVAPAPKPKAPAAAPTTSTAVSAPQKVAPASSQPAVSSQATTSSSQVTVVSAGQGPSKTTPIKFPPRNASRLPTAPSLTKSMASVVSPLTKAGLSNNPAMKQQMTRSVPNVVRHGQPLLSSLIKSGTSQPQSITITSPLAKASLTIPSSPLAKNSVTIPPPRGPVAVLPNRFPRPELSAGASSSQLMPPPSGLPRKLVFDKPTAPLPIRNYTSTTSSSASGSGEPVFVTPLPKNYNNGATAAAKKSPAKAKAAFSSYFGAPENRGSENFWGLPDPRSYVAESGFCSSNDTSGVKEIYAVKRSRDDNESNTAFQRYGNIHFVEANTRITEQNRRPPTIRSRSEAPVYYAARSDNQYGHAT